MINKIIKSTTLIGNHFNCKWENKPPTPIILRWLFHPPLFPMNCQFHSLSLLVCLFIFWVYRPGNFILSISSNHNQPMYTSIQIQSKSGPKLVASCHLPVVLKPGLSCQGNHIMNHDFLFFSFPFFSFLFFSFLSLMVTKRDGWRFLKGSSMFQPMLCLDYNHSFFLFLHKVRGFFFRHEW